MPQCIPIHVSLDNFKTPIVECLNIGETRFNEPFFQKTIMQFRSTHPNVQPYRTTLKHLKKKTCQRTGNYPDGLIFHLSRCGSTLITQMLGTLEASRVLSEPDPINDVLGLEWSYAPQMIQKQTLSDLIQILGYSHQPARQNYFVKFSSWNAVFLPTILSTLPDCPKIFVYRNPIEVMVSLLTHPPKWLSLKNDPIKGAWLINYSPRKIALLSKEEFCARLLSRIMQSVLDAMGSQWMLINYTDLPQAVTAHIAPFFGLIPSQEQKTRMELISQIHSKSFRERCLFVPDSEAKRQAASDEILRVVEQYVTEPYKRLEALRLAQLNDFL